MNQLKIRTMEKDIKKGNAPYFADLIGFKNEKSKGYANMSFTKQLSY